MHSYRLRHVPIESGIEKYAGKAIAGFSIVELLAFGLGSEDWRPWFKKHLINPIPLFEKRVLNG